MLAASDIGGMMAMMPAFATDSAADLRATDTVSVERLRAGLDRMVRDGADVIATTGSFGECHTLLPDEFRTLAHEIGGGDAPARSAVRRRHLGQCARDGGEDARGEPRPPPTACCSACLITFPRRSRTRCVSSARSPSCFPKLNILIYHNPALHHVTLPVEAFEALVKIPADRRHEGQPPRHDHLHETAEGHRAARSA